MLIQLVAQSSHSIAHSEQAVTQLRDSFWLIESSFWVIMLRDFQWLLFKKGEPPTYSK
jgi:putative copper export protein